MEFENGIENIWKYNWIHKKIKLENRFRKLYWKDWKMVLEALENGNGNIGKWRYWKMELDLL